MKKQCWTATLFEVFVAKKSILWNLALWSLHWRFGRKAVCSRYSCGEQLAVKGRLEECVHPMINDERRFINSLYFVKWYTDDNTYTVYICMYIYILYTYFIYSTWFWSFIIFLKHFSDKIQIDCPEWLSYSVSSPQFQQMEIKGEYKSLRQDEIPVWGRHFKKVWMLRVQILEGFDDDIRNWPSSWLADNSFTIWGRVPCERLG